MSREWSEARLRDLITSQVPESAALEFKAAEAVGKKPEKIVELTKDISAFANAAGGTLILGITQDRSTGAAERIDPVDGKQFNAEWMDQLLDRIRPKIAELKVHPVPIGGDPNAVVYVLEIPQGSTAHQATDKRYHRRRNVKVDAMEDYEIRDVMGRRTLPVVETCIQLIFEPNGKEGFLWWQVRNVGDVMARHVYTHIKAPFLALDCVLTPGSVMPCIEFTRADHMQAEPAPYVSHEQEMLWDIHLSNEHSRPLFAQSTLVRRVPFVLRAFSIPEGVMPASRLQYTTFADDMKPVSHVHEYADIKVVKETF